MRRVIFFILGVLVFLLSAPARPAFSAGSPASQDLEKSAQYNYYLGEYYYSQGRFNAAEPYFRRSRELIEKKNQIISERRVKPTFKGTGGGVKGLEYRIGDGDTLLITVWQNEDLTQEVTVRPDGMISFPLVGDVKAMGLTLTQVKNELTKRLQEYIKMPEVSIAVRKLGASKVIVLGQVTYPGVFGVSGRKMVLEAIALAGGFTNESVASSVILVRGGLEKPIVKRLNLTKVLNGKGLADNIELQSEDIIFVPKKFIADVNYALNTLIKPLVDGAYTTQGYRTKRW